MGRYRRPRKPRRRKAAAPPIPPEPDERAPALEPARELELEAEICERWDDDGVWAVYADWLLARGDPYGELLSLELALELETNRAKRGRLEHARRQLVARHVRTFGAWFVPGEHRIEVEPGVVLNMRRGFVRDASIGRASAWPGRPKRMTPREALETIVTASGSRLLRSLRFDNLRWPPLRELLNSLGPLPTLRSFALHESTARLDPTMLGWAPNLRELRLRIRDFSIEPGWAFSQLESLGVDFTEAEPSLALRLAAAKLSGLRRLELVARGDGIALADLEGLLSSRGYPALEHLDLRVNEPRLVEVVLRSPLLAKLRSLVFESRLLHYTLSNLWAEQLIANAEHFAHLERVALESFDLDPQMRRRLADALPNLG